ncbi:MAG: hypothetical protein JWM14_2524 [Chitinophagaceae bacterium]|nr:hypothetical protein [Chitinophagaceae bacterium]
MKKKIGFVMVLAAFALATACSEEKENSADTSMVASDSIATKPLTSIAFADTVHDFGTIKEGEKASHIFKYKNTGDNPLILEDVRPSCGCTLPEWTKDPIAPGAEGIIKVVYNSEGRPGEFHKTITVIANTAAEVVLLKIQGTVTPKAPDIQGPYKNQQ